MSLNNPAFAPWREQALQRGYKSSAAFPLLDGQQCLGSMAVYSDQVDAFEDEEVRLLNELAANLAYGMRLQRTQELRRRGEELLRASEEKYRALIESTSDWIWELDADCNYVYSSPKVAEILGYAPDDIIGKSCLELMPPEEAERLRPEFTASFAARRPIRNLEIQALHRDGSVLILETSGVPVFDGEGNFTGYRGIDRDITERKRAQEKLRTTSLYVRSLIEASLDPLVTISAEGKITDVNAATEAVTGYPRESLIGQDFLGFFTEPELARAGYEQAFQDGVVRDYALEIRHRDGHVTPVLYNATVYRDEAGKVMGVFAAARDITERKRTEDLLLTNERYFRAFFERPLVGMATSSPDKGWLEVNDRLCQMLGYSRSELTQKVWPEMTHPDDLEADLANLNRLLAGEIDDYTLDKRFIRKDGRVLYSHVSVSCVRKTDGTVDFLVILIEDVTEQHLAEEKLRQAAKVFQSTTEGVTITDQSGEIISVNRAFETITGYTAEEAIGQTPRILKSGRHDAAFYRVLWNRLIHDGQWQGEVWNRRKSGEIYPEWLSISSTRDSAGNLQNFIAVFSDISSLKEAEERIRNLAYFDPLTQLPNRQLLFDRLQQALIVAERSDTKLALAFLDLDRFKTINDSLGHSVGDELLIQVAARLRGCLRESDTVARLGGDEFLIILPQLSDIHYVTMVVRKISKAVSEPYLIGKRELHITPSIGIAIYPENGLDPETLIRNADAAMYQAKALGRNDFQFYTEELNVRATEQLLIENSLRRALEREEFMLHYQPQIDLRSGRVVGAEALIRWRHPDLGLTYPAKFIRSAEACGQIIEIGEWVLTAVCRQLQKCRLEGYPMPRVAVNLSVVQFRQRSFLDRVMRIVEEANISPQCLELELTESILMDNTEASIDVLTHLKACGFSISVDDFGTGYSSLSYLKLLPIEKLKIDQSFVRDCIHDENDAAIIRAIIGLSNSLGLKVIAEGIETLEQMNLLAGLGCHEGQGYYLGRPCEAVEFCQLLKTTPL